MKVYLFDFNGTLFNDMLAWHEGVKRLFKKFGKEAPTIATFFKELEAAHGDYLSIYRSRGIDVSREELNAIYGRFYQEQVADVQLSDHAEETLRALSDLGVVLGLITTSPEELCVPILKKFGVMKLFRHVRYHSIDKKHDIKDIVAKESVSGLRCCYVGDSSSDIRHANNAGVVSVAFLDGHIPEDLILAAQPRRTIRDFRELLSFVA